MRDQRDSEGITLGSLGVSSSSGGITRSRTCCARRRHSPNRNLSKGSAFFDLRTLGFAMLVKIENGNLNPRENGNLGGSGVCECVIAEEQDFELGSSLALTLSV